MEAPSTRTLHRNRRASKTSEFEHEAGRAKPDVRGPSKVGDLMIRHRSSGIDMSAAFFDVCLTISRRIHERRFEAGPEGFRALSAWLEEICAGFCWFGIEHTGGYEQNLAMYLLEQGHRVSLLDAKRVHDFKGSEGKRSKTDKGDARIIAKFVAQKKPALWAPRPDAFAELLDLKRHRDDLVKAITMWKNRKSSPRVNAFVDAQTDTAIAVFELQLKAVEQEIQRCVESDREIGRSVNRMVTVPGIGFTTAVAFLAEAGPITGRTYPTPESLALSAGLAPLARMSGTSVRGTFTRPYGNSNLRNCLNLPAVVAKNHDPALALFAARMEHRGKCKPVQNRAVKRKLVHILWALVLKDQDYDPQKAVWKYPQDKG